MKRTHLLGFGASCLILLMTFGCASVTVTKTAKGYFSPTDPDEIEILVTVPNRNFIELATVTTKNWPTNDTAKMHNSLRAKCAPLGANAVILGSSGIDHNGYFWASGVAIRYKSQLTTREATKIEKKGKKSPINKERKLIGYRATSEYPSGKIITTPVYEANEP